MSRIGRAMPDPVRSRPGRLPAGIRLALILVSGGLLAVLAVASTAMAKDQHVTIADFSFSPASVTIFVGETVTWTNTGPGDHSVTADDGSFDSGELAPLDSFANVFDQAGTFTYHSTGEAQLMKGTVIVKAALPTPTLAGTPPPTPPSGTRPPNLPTPTPFPTPASEAPSPGGGGTSAVLPLIGGAAVVVLGLGVLVASRRRGRGASS